MSVRVNLLPGDVAEKNKAARGRVLVAIGAASFLALLAAAYVFQLGRVAEAEAALEEEQAAVAALRADLAELQEFSELSRRADEQRQVLSTALSTQASVAGVLQDLAAVFPGDAELQSLTVNVNNVPQAAEIGDVQPSFGLLTATGRTLRGHAPGVERLLLQLDKIAAFRNVYLSNSTIDEEGVSTFTLDSDLGPEVRTGRYPAPVTPPPATAPAAGETAEGDE